MKKLNKAERKMGIRIIVFLSMILFVSGLSAGDSAIRPLSCYQNLQMSIGPSGFIKVTPDMVLTDTFANYAPFVVNVKGRNTDTIFCDDVNKSVMVMVTDTRNNNSCWSTVSIEDKLPPVLTCLNDTLPCYVNPDTLDYSQYASAIDNCDDDVDLYFEYIIDDLFCDPDYSVIVTMTWTATDDQGLSSTCTGQVLFEKVDVQDTEFPLDTQIYCPVLDTLILGVPLLDSLPISALCDLVPFYRDDTIPGRCSGEYSIMRTWTVLDICPNGRTISDIQKIDILDTLAPVIVCPDTTTIGTEDTSCTGVYIIPPVLAMDACGADSLIMTTFQMRGGPVFMEGDTVILDTGLHFFFCTAMDDCGNIDTCTKVIKVIDNVAPTLFCIPDLEVFLDTNGFAKLCLKDLDHLNFYSDNCGIADISISKMEEKCDTSLNPYPGFCVNFCCEEVMDSNLMVVITVTDLSGNENFCMIQTNVQDTIPPVITESPADTTVSCTVDYRDTSITGGRVIFTDNCFNIIDIEFFDIDSLSACDTGFITRFFVVCDPMNNCDTAIQIITIENNFVFADSLIQWTEDSICIEDCPSSYDPDSIGSRVTIIGDSCNVVEVTWQDIDSFIRPGDVCLIIERRWTVLNECRDTFMMDSTQIIEIKNFLPPILSGPPTDTTISVGPDSCLVRVVLPELGATDCTTGLTVTNDCTNTGANVNIVLGPGQKVITYTATDSCGNSSTFQTTINILDEAGPILVCPPDTTVDCNTSLDTALLGVPLITDNCSEVEMVTLEFIDDTITGNCAQEFTVERTFTATDSSGNSSTCLQTIMVQDTIDPDIICPRDTTVSCETMTGSGTLGIATATDNCQAGMLSVTERDSIVDGGCDFERNIFRIFSATDDCGNSATCIQVITVIDTTPPTITCPPDITVSCTEQTDPMNTGTPTVGDNCGVNLVTTRRDSIIPGMGQTLRTIFRIWTVTDECGNEVSCTQIIVVRDTQPPTIICPADTTVQCDTRIDSLGLFGSPDARDNCSGIIITADTIFDLNICNVGTITRVFTAMDSVGNVSSCEQVVTFELTDTLQEMDITWPDSIIEVDACVGVDPDSIPRGRPMIDSSAASCFLVSFNFVDSIDYNCVPGVCTTLTRKWTLIDSCQLDTMGRGIFCFTQEIRVVDTMKPTITGIMNDTVYLHPDSMCDAYFRIKAEAEDCSGIKSIRNNSRFGRDTMCDASGRYPRGLTPITFIAEDSCCNADTQLIFIIVLDTIPPRITCQDAEKRIIGEAGMGMAEFCISELVVTTTDNCDPKPDLRISFDPNDPFDTCRVYNCDSLMGNGGLMRRLTIYILDAGGNTSTCVSTVRVTDPFGVCAGNIIGGQVSNVHQQGIENAKVEIMQRGEWEMTDAAGGYVFEEMDQGQTLDIAVSKEEPDPLNGISTADLLMIYRHLLGISEFDTPYELLAADANASASIEVRDIVHLRKLILGIIDELEDAPAWYFMDAYYPWESDLHPLLQEKAFGYHIDTLQSHMNIGFIGVKTGDVNGDAHVNGFMKNQTRSDQKIDLTIQQRNTTVVGEEEIAFVDFLSSDIPGGVQVAFDFPDYAVEIKDVKWLGSEASQMEYAVVNGELRILWLDPWNDLSLDQFRIAIQYEAYDKVEGEIFSLSQKFSETTWQTLETSGFNQINRNMLEPSTQGFMLSQNTPNPFTDATIIGVYQPFDEEGSLEVFDATGRLVFTKSVELTAGWNHLEVNQGDLGGAGIYLCKVSSSQGAQTKRMILME